MRVLSPRMEPPDTVDEGSMASTATRSPRSTRYTPSASMKVLLPTPGTPLMPRRSDWPVCGSNAVSSSSPWARWSARVDSSSVMALAMARRCTAPRAFTRASTETDGPTIHAAARAILICSSTSLALAGIGVPGP